MITLSAMTFQTQAKGIQNMYVQRSAGGESVFFIFSQKLPACKDSKQEAKKVDYDYTYVQRTDSVSLLMTLELKEVVRNLNVTITNPDICIKSVPELIFAKAKGKGMQYRLRMMMTFAEFEKLYYSTSPFTMSASTFPL